MADVTFRLIWFKLGEVGEKMAEAGKTWYASEWDFDSNILDYLLLGWCSLCLVTVLGINALISALGPLQKPSQDRMRENKDESTTAALPVETANWFNNCINWCYLHYFHHPYFIDEWINSLNDQLTKLGGPVQARIDRVQSGSLPPKVTHVSSEASPQDRIIIHAKLETRDLSFVVFASQQTHEGVKLTNVTANIVRLKGTLSVQSYRQGHDIMLSLGFEGHPEIKVQVKPLNPYQEKDELVDLGVVESTIRHAIKLSKTTFKITSLLMAGGLNEQTRKDEHQGGGGGAPHGGAAPHGGGAAPQGSDHVQPPQPRTGLPRPTSGGSSGEQSGRSVTGRPQPVEEIIQVTSDSLQSSAPPSAQHQPAVEVPLRPAVHMKQHSVQQAVQQTAQLPAQQIIKMPFEQAVHQSAHQNKHQTTSPVPRVVSEPVPARDKVLNHVSQHKEPVQEHIQASVSRQQQQQQPPQQQQQQPQVTKQQIDAVPRREQQRSRPQQRPEGVFEPVESFEFQSSLYSTPANTAPANTTTANTTPANTAPAKPPKMVGDKRLLVKVIKANGLAVKEIGAAHSVCMVSTDEPVQGYATSVVKNTAHPFWDEYFIFDITRDTQEVRVEVYDRAKPHGDEFIGEAIIYIEDLRKTPSSRQILRLHPQPGTCEYNTGSVTAEFLFMDPSEADLLLDSMTTADRHQLSPRRRIEVARSVAPGGTLVTKTTTTTERPMYGGLDGTVNYEKNADSPQLSLYNNSLSNVSSGYGTYTIPTIESPHDEMSDGSYPYTADPAIHQPQPIALKA